MGYQSSPLVEDPGTFSVRGGIVGASLSTTRADLAYAVLAGVALNTRWAWSCARRLAPGNSDPIRMLGGAAQSSIWPQIMADMLQHPVAVMEDGTWGGSRGAAMTAESEPMSLATRSSSA